MNEPIESKALLGAALFIIGILVPTLRLFCFYSLPWKWAFFPLLVWVVSIIVRSYQSVKGEH